MRDNDTSRAVNPGKAVYYDAAFLKSFPYGFIDHRENVYNFFLASAIEPESMYGISYHLTKVKSRIRGDCLPAFSTGTTYLGASSCVWWQFTITAMDMRAGSVRDFLDSRTAWLESNTLFFP